MLSFLFKKTQCFSFELSVHQKITGENGSPFQQKYKAALFATDNNKINVS